MVTRFKHWFYTKRLFFGAVKLTRNSDTDKYKYRGYSIGFNSQSAFSLPDGSKGKNAIIFGADMISSVHIDNKGKDILTFGEGPMQGLGDTTLTAEAKNSIYFKQSSRKFCLSLHYNRSSRFLFNNATKIYQFKAKDSEIKNPLCLGIFQRISQLLTWNKPGLNGYVYKFSVDSNIIDIINK